MAPGLPGAAAPGSGGVEKSSDRGETVGLVGKGAHPGKVPVLHRAMIPCCKRGRG